MTPLGPPGLAIGGAVGGCIAYVLGDGKFKPVSQVILHEMQPEDRIQLANSVRRILSDLDATDAMNLMVLLNTNAALKGRIVTEISSFFANQLNLAVL